MANPFPLYVRLDDGELIRIESMNKILHHLEAIDIENDEYTFWDAEGNGVKVVLTGKVGRIHSPGLSGIRAADNPRSFQDAAQEWAIQLGVQVDTTGSPQQIWERLREAQANLPTRKSLFSRLFKTSRSEG